MEVFLRILSDRGTEFCGRPERHDYQLYLAINGNSFPRLGAPRGAETPYDA